MRANGHKNSYPAMTKLEAERIVGEEIEARLRQIESLRVRGVWVDGDYQAVKGPTGKVAHVRTSPPKFVPSDRSHEIAELRECLILAIEDRAAGEGLIERSLRVLDATAP